MKTVQECLREADRERLLDALAYDDLCDVYLLRINRLVPDRPVIAYFSA